jgi:hypothetical protein
MAPLVGITADLRAVFAAHIPFKFVDGRRLWPAHDVEGTREARYYFAKEHNLFLVGAVLREIQKSLDEALRLSKSPGGRIPCTFRHWFIINLAAKWKEMGRDPRSSGPFAFPDFCEHVFEAIDWPLAGIRRAIDKALADLPAGL